MRVVVALLFLVLVVNCLREGGDDSGERQGNDSADVRGDDGGSGDDIRANVTTGTSAASATTLPTTEASSTESEETQRTDRNRPPMAQGNKHEKDERSRTTPLGEERAAQNMSESDEVDTMEASNSIEGSESNSSQSEESGQSSNTAEAASSTTAAASEVANSTASTSTTIITGAAASNRTETTTTTTGAAASNSTETTTTTTGAAASNHTETTTTTTGAAASNHTETTTTTTGAAASNRTETTTTTTGPAASNRTETTTTPSTTGAASTTVIMTTTESLPPIRAKVQASVKIVNHEYASWMPVPITTQYKQFTGQLISAVQPQLMTDIGAQLVGMKVKGLRRGSVIADIEVILDTSTSNISAVDTDAVAEQVRGSLKNITETDTMMFDPAAVTVDGSSIELIEPTEAPPSLEELYRASYVRLEMRAPNANYTEDYNNTDSMAFKWLQGNISEGVKEMLKKKYPVTLWNITSTLEAAWNDTTKGIGVRFMVEIEPQWTNTTENVGTMAKYYVYFSRIGPLQIDPSSVRYDDMTTYAPGDGMVVKNREYYRKLAARRNNGSYVGDFSTPRPTLRPIVKRHDGYVKGIALPAFLGMLAALGLLLICTTIAGGNKKSID